MRKTKLKDDSKTEIVDEDGNQLNKKFMSLQVPFEVHSAIKVIAAMYQMDMTEIVIRLWKTYGLSLEKDILEERRLKRPRRMENGFIVD